MSKISTLIEKHAALLERRLKQTGTKRIYNLPIPHLALFLSFYRGRFIVVEEADENARILFNDLNFFNKLTDDVSYEKADRKILFFPPQGSPDAAGKRAKAIFEARAAHDAIVISSKESLPTGFAVSEIDSALLAINKKMEIERGNLEAALIKLGYKAVSMVVEPGEFSRREWLFDIYPAAEDMPIRVEFFGDEIETIRAFDISTQRSVREIERIDIFAATEDEPKKDLITELLNIKANIPEAVQTRFLDMEIFVVNPVKMESSRDGDMGKSVIDRDCKRLISVSHFPFIGDGIDANSLTFKGSGIPVEERKDFEHLIDILKISEKKSFIVLPSASQAQRLREIMLDNDFVVPIIETDEIKSFEGNLCITIGSLSSGVNLSELMILTDREIFGERPSHRAIRKSKASRLLLNIDDLAPGDFVVHRDHGIGRFVCLNREKRGDYEEDLITIEYDRGDRIYIPLQGVGILQKYSGSGGHAPAIDRLGGKRWQQAKQKVKRDVRELAEKLIKLYAQRKAARGFTFSEDTFMHREFDDFFPYEETADQITSIEEIKKHMYSDTPMDMLICGDVGYGKTEVAMKAAFRAVYDAKQVVVLVPTTILAEQHFRSFKERFSGFPARIECLNRFKSRAEIKRIIKAAADGEVDIVIGTHMLLNKGVRLHDLGLMIIDEEHRFGVAQKERLKELKKGVDVLTLTATPIPRTLHMSLSGIRDMCTIETPPEDRLAVRSIVSDFNDRIIREAIEKEINREGQVFFVHNRVKDIHKVADYLKRLAPNARIITAHGQMRENDLEGIMLSFLNREADLLVSTTIIASGLDIPSANTIIINRADAFGLSDLYQLRGRVGRGDRQAFAIFLTPGEDILTDEAKKRLQAIQEMSYLGAGFRLALRDLDIRGAGNLLGHEQSGHIHRIGFDMYMELLEKAVAELKGEEVREEFEPHIKIGLSAYIPEDYIQDINLRLAVYRRIASIKSLQDLLRLKEEITDRFGRLKEPVENLLHIIKIKMLARRLYISKVSEANNRYSFAFASDKEVKLDMDGDFFDRLLNALFALHKKETGMRFLQNGFELNLQTLSMRDAINRVEDILHRLWTLIEK
ncbi:MAG: transcription-repair coupling factor [Nitrospirae bacterium]|nr:transcription-repair coupling factor [Nitrospirota bacterium]